ncbi:MAG: DNA polymerase III subunit delta' [Actinomycetota bacterium]
MTGATGEGRVFGTLVGQARAVNALRAAARAPVHAYLFVGPPGGGKRPAARAFAAAVMCPQGGCGQCETCRRVLADVHPDVVTVERDGAYISVGQAREIQRLAMRTPNEGHRKVLVLNDFHLVREAGPTLLKVIEEPPPSTIFLVLADHLPPELVTIASRCVRIEFGRLSQHEIEAALVAEGVGPDRAAEAAEAAEGRLDRARILASDPGLEDRRRLWRSVPARLDGTGATVSRLAGELVVMLGSAAVGPLEARHAEERAALEARIERSGERGGGRKLLVERQRRELRRLRADELRYGLAVLAGTYRDALAAGVVEATAFEGPGPARARELAASVDALQDAAEAIVRNPSESLFLQALLLRLAPLGRP